MAHHHNDSQIVEKSGGHEHEKSTSVFYQFAEEIATNRVRNAEANHRKSNRFDSATAGDKRFSEIGAHERQ